MKKDVLIMLLGALVAALLFLGFPNSWDTIFLALLGICIIGLGIMVRRGDRPKLRFPDFKKPADASVPAQQA